MFHRLTELKIEAKKESLAEQLPLGPNLSKNYLDWKSFLN